MPDISMCDCHTCPSKNKCYRYMAIPNFHWQAYSNYEPKKGEKKCDDFIIIQYNDRLKQI